MQKRKIRSAEQRTQTICLLVLSAIAIGMALLHLRQVLVPFVLALFLTLAVTPVMDILHTRLKMPRGLAIGTTIGIATGALLLMGVLVSTAIADVVAKDSAYVEQVSGLLTAGKERMAGLQANLEGAFGHSTDEEPDESEPQGSAQTPIPASDGSAPAADDRSAAQESPAKQESALDDPLADLEAKVPGMVAQAIGWTVNSGMALLSQGLLVMIFMMFLIAGYRAPDQRDPESLTFQVRAQVKEYLRIKILVSALTGLGTFAILSTLGVDLALVFGLMAFFLNFIPNIGSAVAVLLPVPIIVLAPAIDLSLTSKLLAVALPACLQFLVGNVLEPRWLGKSLDLNPIVVLLSLIFWGVLWGPVGMLLSVPITASIKMLLERSELTRPVAAILSEAD